MELVRVKLRDNKAKAALKRLEKEGAIEIVNASPEQDLADLMRLIRKSVSKKLTLAEVAKESEAVRSGLFQKPKHAASRKAQARR
jgi:hypothetical protein